MLEPIFTNRFKKEYILMEKRHKDMNKIIELMALIIWEEPLPKLYNDHPLVSNYKGFMECHIAPDWLLIYKIDPVQKAVLFSRTGTHSDLF